MVENLSNNTWMTFNNLPDEQYYQINLTKKAFWGTVGINDLNNGAGFIEVQNLPGSLVLSFIKNTPERINLSIFNIAGQKIYSESNKLINPGNSIRVQPGATGVYLIKIETLQGTRSFKVIGQTIYSENKVEILDGTSVITSQKSATYRVDENFDFNIGDNIRVSIYKSNNFAKPIINRIENSRPVNFKFEGLQDSNTFVLAGKIDLSIFPDLETNGLSVHSINRAVDVKINGTYQLTNEKENSELLPLLFVKEDNILFGAIDIDINDNGINVDEILLFYYMLFPDVAYSGISQNEFIELMRNDSNYNELKTLVLNDINNNIPIAENSQFVSLLQNSSISIVSEYNNRTKSATNSNGEIFDTTFSFNFKRDGTISWKNKGPVFASLGFEIQDLTGKPINNKPFFIDPSKWIISPTSFLAWVLSYYDPTVSGTSTYKFTNPGEYKIVFTNGNNKGLASDKLYEQVRNSNTYALMGDIIMIVLPTMGSFKLSDCGQQILSVFETKYTFLKDMMVRGVSRAEVSTALLDLSKNILVSIEKCASSVPEKLSYFQKIVHQSNVLKTVDYFNKAESVANLYSFTRDFYGSAISGDEKRFYYNGTSFGELDYKSVSEKDFKGEPKSEHQYEALVKEEIIKYDIERGLLSTEFIKKEEQGDANELPFKAILIKGDAKVIDTNPKVQLGSLNSEFEMGKDSSIVIITPDFPYKNIVPDTIRLFPENSLKQQLIALSPWKWGAYLIYFKENSLDSYEYDNGELIDWDSIGWGILSENSIWWEGDGDIARFKAKIEGKILYLSYLCSENPTDENCEDVFFSMSSEK